MSNIIKLYKILLHKYPLRVSSIQTGILMGTGDQIAQNFVEKRHINDIDFIRSAKFLCIGSLMVGPTARTWYAFLERRIGSKTGKDVIKKVIIDQGFFAPVFITVLLTVIGITQGKDIEGIKEKLKNDYKDILTNNYKLWPFVQLINFYFVRLEYQVLVVQTVALFWNTYVSYRTNIDLQLVDNSSIEDKVKNNC